MIETYARRTYIKELTDRHSRKELNEIASALGLDPAHYSKKRALAEAILKMREPRESAIEEAITKSVTPEEVLEVEEVPMSSVRSIVEAAQQKASDFKAFYAGDFRQGMKAFQDALQAFRQSIQDQMKKNDDFVKNEFNQNVKSFHQSIRAFQQSIMDQAKENQKFIKQFYG